MRWHPNFYSQQTMGALVTIESWVPLAAALSRQCLLNLTLKSKDQWPAKMHAIGTQCPLRSPRERNANPRRTSKLALVSSTQNDVRSLSMHGPNSRAVPELQHPGSSRASLRTVNKSFTLRCQRHSAFFARTSSGITLVTSTTSGSPWNFPCTP